MFILCKARVKKRGNILVKFPSFFHCCAHSKIPVQDLAYFHHIKHEYNAMPEYLDFISRNYPCKISKIILI